MTSIFNLFKKRGKCKVCESENVFLTDYRLSDDKRLCEVCLSRMDLEEASIFQMDSYDFKRHLDYREENKKLLEAFKISREYDSSRGVLRVDDNRRLWYFMREGEENPPIFKFEETLGMTVRRREREGTLEEENKGICSVLNDLELEIELDNTYHKTFRISLLEDSHITECSMLYKIYNDRLDDIFSIFESIIQQEED